MSPLMACPSPQGEQPEGPREKESTAASQTETAHDAPSAASPCGLEASSLHSPGSAEPATPAASVPPETESAQVGDSADVLSDGMEHFQRLRRRMLLSTLLASSAAVPVCWLLFDLPAALSLLVGSVAGVLYLVLLARSVSRLGGDRRSVGKVQLLVPVVLVLASTRVHQLELVPALVGFLLYKPALLIQAYLDR